MKKLEGHQAEVIKGIINEGGTIFEIEGRRYEMREMIRRGDL